MLRGVTKDLEFGLEKLILCVHVCASVQMCVCLYVHIRTSKCK